MDKIIKFFLDNRALVVVLSLGLAIGGFLAFDKVPIDAIPDIGENQIIVFTDWPGRSPKDVEDQVTYPLSIQLQGISGIKTIRASSALGFSIVYVVFNDDVDFYWARTRILEKLATISGTLPRDAVPKLGPDATGLGQIFWYTVEGEGYDLGTLRSVQDWFVRYQLQAVPGVSEVASVGGFVKQYQVLLDPTKLLGYNISIAKIVKAIRNSNIDVGAKVIEENKIEYLVRGIGFIKSKEDIENIVIAQEDNVPIYVKNLGRVTIGPDFRRNALDKEGAEVTGGVVLMRFGENPARVIEAIKKKIKDIEPGLPKGVRIVSFYDRSLLIDRTIDTLKEALTTEVLVTIAIVTIALFHLPSAFIISISLPLAVLFAFIVMYFFGVESNIMSLAGIAIAIGAMVDMAIIMTESIYSKLASLGPEESRLEAIKNAASEVGGPITAAISTTIISFLPVFALEGQEGKLFTPLAWIKTFALIGSVLVAIVIVPTFCHFFLRGKLRPMAQNPFHKFLVHSYQKALALVFRFKERFLVLILIIIGISVFLGSRVGREFMPPLDEGDILFMPVMMPSVNINEALRVMKQQDMIIKAHPEVSQVVGKLGRAETATDPAPVEMFETIINLKPKEEWRAGITKAKIIQELDSALKIPGVANIWTQPIVNRIDMLSTGIRTEVGVKIFGPSLMKLEEIGGQIEKVLKKVPGVVDLYAEKLVGKPYIEILIDRTKVARYGIHIETVQNIISTAIGGMNISYTVEGRERYPISVRYPEELRNDVDRLKRILVPSSIGSAIPLGQLSEIRKVMGPNMINSENGMLRAYVMFNIRGRDPIGVVEEASKLVREKVKLPRGYSLAWAGQFQNQIRAKKRLMFLVPISLILNFFILYLTFNSGRNALIVFSAIPLAISGGLILLYFSGFNISVAVWVGFIALFGIAVDDAVVMLTYITSLLKKKSLKTKEELRELILEAGGKRIRPLFMTTLTTVGALIPILFLTGAGAEVIKPMAIPTLGGMGIEILTLFVTPVVFYMFEGRNLASGGEI